MAPAPASAVQDVAPEDVQPLDGGWGVGEPQGGEGPPLYTYVVTTSANDPLCEAPLADADGVPDAYVDLAAFGIAPQAVVVGNNIAFSIAFTGGGPIDFWGDLQSPRVFFSDDGFVWLDPLNCGAGTDPCTGPGGFPPHQPIPTASDPNNLLAVLWRDFTVVTGGGRGVSLARLTSGGMTVAFIVEYDDVQVTGQQISNCCSPQATPGCDDPVCEAAICGIDPFCCEVVWDQFCSVPANNSPDCFCALDHYDFELVGFYQADDTPGAYEWTFAYKNLIGPTDQGTIGLETLAGTFGVQVAFDDVDISDGFAICFDRVLNNQPPDAVCQDVTVAADDTCTASANVDGGSSDPDGDELTFEQDPPGPYPLGETEVLLTVTDSSGASDSCTATVTVVDETPPVVTCSIDPFEDDESEDESDDESDDEGDDESDDESEGSDGSFFGRPQPQAQTHGPVGISLLPGGENVFTPVVPATQPNSMSNYAASDTCGEVTVVATLTPGPDAPDDDESEDEDSESEDEPNVCETFQVADDQLFSFKCKKECKTKVKNGLIDIKANGLTMTVVATDEAGNTGMCTATISCPPPNDDDAIIEHQAPTPTPQGTVDFNRRR